MERIIAYVDGYNLYYGLRTKGWKRFYWLNIQKLIQQLLKPDQVLVEVKYFTTVITQPEDRRLRQKSFLEALQTLSNFHIYYGQFLSETITCRNCGHSYTTHHEKMTDVNMSVELIQDAFQNNFDVAFILSADSDLVPPIKAVQTLFNEKRVVAVFPPGRNSYALKQSANGFIHIGHLELAKSIFPDQIEKDGIILRKPDSWK